VQTSRRPSAARAKSAKRGGHSRSLRRLAAFGLSLCLAGTLALAVASAGGSTAAPATASSSLAATRVRDLPPPARSLMARRQDRRADAERLTAFPATVTASGGRVRLRASVRDAVRCHFHAAGRVRLLRATRRCSSSAASITIRVPRNGAGVRRRYVVYLTVVSRRGARRTIRDVILQRREATAPGGNGRTPGETAASGTHTSGSQASAPQSAGSSAADQSGSGGQGSAPLVTNQPAGENVQPGSPVTLAASASGTPAPSVQWQVSADGGTTWVDTASSFVASAADSGRQYRAVFSNSAGTVTTNPVTLTVAPLSTTNFSGYIDYAGSGQSFTSVSAAWTVPTVTCQPGETSWAAQWPGIGDATTVQQDGTETDCENGSPVYWAWYEMYGDSAVNNGYAFPLPGNTYPVSPGDAMTGSVSVSGSTWQLSLGDLTANWSFSIQFPSPAGGLSQGSAEWMVEDPDGCVPQCQTLAQYSPVQFASATATENGQGGPISAFPATALQIVQNSTLLSAPAVLDPTGDGFTDSWYAS
jgi:hypothetical protein